MATVFDLMGTVTSVSEHSGNVVSPAIQGPVKSLFGASRFFAFGVRCTGALTDLLEIGMEVKVRYIFGIPHSDIVAVWLGEKPDCLKADSFYSREGCIVSVNDDHILAKSNLRDELILVSNDVVFCDGFRVNNTKTEVKVGEVVLLDAVPIRTHSSEIQYLATCAWFGLNEPRILDRFHYFLSARANEEFLEVDHVVGRVSVIPNDSVALVDVDAFNSGKVILAKQSFHPRCESLRLAFGVGEELMMRLCFGRYYSDDNMWYVVAASKHSGSYSSLSIVERRHTGEPGRAWHIPPEDEETASVNAEDQTAADNLPGEVEEEQSDLLAAVPELLLNSSTEVKCEISDDLDPLSHFASEPPNASEGEVILPTTDIKEEVDSYETPFSDESPLPIKEEMDCTFRNETGQEHVAKTEEPELTANGQEESDIEVLYETPLKMPRLEEVWVQGPILHEVDDVEPESNPISDDESQELSPLTSEKNDESVYAKALAYIHEEEAAEAVDQEGSSRDPSFHFPEKRMSFGRVCRGAPFQKGPGSRTFLLDWSAVVAMDQGTMKFSALVGSDFGEVSTEISNVIINAMNEGKPVTSKTLRTYGQNVYFDAERRPQDNTFIVKRIWFKQANRPSAELLLKRELRYSGSATFNPSEVYRGKIISVPLHDCAIASLDTFSVPVLVKLDSLVTDRCYNQSCTTIDMYLNTGSDVFVDVVKREGIRGNSFFEAKKCWNQIICLPTYPQIHNNKSWSDIWGQVELFVKGEVTEKDGCVGITLSISESVDVTNCRFFAYGNLSRMSEYVGCSVTCHVIQLEGKSVVPYASIGRRLLDYTFFESRQLDVPRQLIEEKAYEGVVEDYPLVDFAVCRIGVIPVICFLSPVKNKTKSHFSTIVEKDLRIGQRVLLDVKEQSNKNSTFLVCMTMIVNEFNDDKKVFVSFTGRVVKQPKPTGLIEANGGNLKVSFDLSCVRNPLGGMSISTWAKKIRKVLKDKNTTVHFTAKKGPSPEKPHTAYMVWIDNF